ncbi:hypothetical protein DFH29DRAFT_998896 [Suillus ampliporus]|nr:hypothetical protein DFH29DRAFT_998896 [Suillus ampliporus]
MGRDGVSASPHDAMTADSFLECFRNNLLDIAIDPLALWHPLLPPWRLSVSRNGAKVAASARSAHGEAGQRISTNPGTIFKYLLSWNDAPLLQREDYFNPD